MKVITISRTNSLNAYTHTAQGVVITTSSGRRIVVDDADLGLLAQYTWCVTGTGYAMSRTTGKAVLMHRLLTNAAKGEYVDHINGNPLDNRRSNLRVCCKQQNEFNAKTRADNTSGYRGVCPARRGRFRAYITKDGKQYPLGGFANARDAAIAYNAAAIRLFGEYARLNNIKD